MRRIYESEAITRDDDQQFTPGEHTREEKPQSFRSVNASAWSDRLLPVRLRQWAVSVSVSVPRSEFQQGEQIPFAVTFRNRLPVPVTVPTGSPAVWQWRVDDHLDASRLEENNRSDGSGKLRLKRGENRQVRRRWSQRFRVGGREWVDAETGEHTISAAVTVADPAGSGLRDETTIQIRP
jgi:hypothetical protein